MNGRHHFSALVRDDRGGLQVRRFRTARAATLVAMERELPEPAEVAAIAGRARGGELSVRQFADQLGVSHDTVRRAVNAGALPGTKEHGPRLVKIPASTLRLAQTYGLRVLAKLQKHGLVPGGAA